MNAVGSGVVLYDRVKDIVYVLRRAMNINSENMFSVD